jgi:hypothetical protein
MMRSNSVRTKKPFGFRIVEAGYGLNHDLRQELSKDARSETTALLDRLVHESNIPNCAEVVEAFIQTLRERPRWSELYAFAHMIIAPSKKWRPELTQTIKVGLSVVLGDGSWKLKGFHLPHYLELAVHGRILKLVDSEESLQIAYKNALVHWGISDPEEHFMSLFEALEAAWHKVSARWKSEYPLSGYEAEKLAHIFSIFPPDHDHWRSYRKDERGSREEIRSILAAFLRKVSPVLEETYGEKTRKARA